MAYGYSAPSVGGMPSPIDNLQYAQPMMQSPRRKAPVTYNGYAPQPSDGAGFGPKRRAPVSFPNSGDGYNYGGDMRGPEPFYQDRNAQAYGQYQAQPQRPMLRPMGGGYNPNRF